MLKVYKVCWQMMPAPFSLFTPDIPRSWKPPRKRYARYDMEGSPNGAGVVDARAAVLASGRSRPYAGVAAFVILLMEWIHLGFRSNCRTTPTHSIGSLRSIENYVRDP